MIQRMANINKILFGDQKELADYETKEVDLDGFPYPRCHC